MTVYLTFGIRDLVELDQVSSGDEEIEEIEQEWEETDYMASLVPYPCISGL